MYELFEHTADLGLWVEAADLPMLFAEAGRGLCAMLVDNAEDVRADREIHIDVSGSEAEPEYLLFDWLNELLYRFETEGFLPAEFEVSIGAEGLKAVVRGEAANPARHRMAHEVKAITYHRLSVEQTKGGWRAELIVDI
ncbi:MAG: archease [Planctomycetes bacterium]|nr:archease [Planctomycetota bacterium]